MTATDARERASGVRFRLGGRARKTVLVVHIAAAGSWLGLDLALGALVVAALAGADGRGGAAGPGATDAVGAASAAVAATALAGWPLAAAGTLVLATGILLGLGSKYGLVRTWWVLVKLVVNVVLLALVLFLLPGGVAGFAEQGRAALTASGALEPAPNILAPPIVSSTAVLVAMVLSVFKPWGRIRRAARPAEGVR